MKPQFRNTIFVNADDLGMSSSINRAIAKSFDCEIINSATLMANMPGFEEAIYLIHFRKLESKIGIHLVLTEGVPLTELVNSENLFFDKNDILRRYHYKKLLFLTRQQRNYIYNEFRAQIEKVKKNGITITHLDTHHQIHDLWSIINIMLCLLKEYNIPSMRILNNLNKSRYYYKNAYRDLINAYLKFRKANFTDYLGNQLALLTILEKNPTFFKDNNKKFEIMVHPDFNDRGQLIDKVANTNISLKLKSLWTP